MQVPVVRSPFVVRRALIPPRLPADDTPSACNAEPKDTSFRDRQRQRTRRRLEYEDQTAVAIVMKF
jgi:hypothetical protein